MLALTVAAPLAILLLCTAGPAAVLTSGGTTTVDCAPTPPATPHPPGSPPASHTANCNTTISPHGWTQPVPGRIISGFRTPDRPGHDGVDLGAPRGTVIRAAAAGIVTLVRCNATLHGTPISCDQDGSPAVKGCGWYLEITHTGHVITRYCHMSQRPSVTIGQQVAAGQPLGLVGSSGNSSGPHLHFEVHLGLDRSAAGAVSPQAFMASKGAPLPS